jgi:signal transduction histidine kinase
MHRPASDLPRSGGQGPHDASVAVRAGRLSGGRHFRVANDVPLSDGQGMMHDDAPLSRLAAEMEVMLENTRHGVSLWTFDRTLIMTNRMTAELLEVPADFLVNGLSQEKLLRFMAARGAFGAEGQAEAYIQATIRNDPRQPWTSERLTQAGKIIEVRSTPADGQAYTIVTYTDVTEERRIARHLQEVASVAEEASAARARFLATMSHELRTPLNAVIGFSDTLMRDRGTTAPAQAREYAEEINAAGKRLLMLLNNMLDVARIEAGRFDLSTDRIDVTRMVQAGMRQFRNAALAAEIDLFIDLPDQLPSVRGDERRMQQVISSLLSNAVKFSKPGGSVTVSAQLDEQGDLIIKVSDTGIGIAEDQIQHVFEPFTQADGGLNRHYEGSGLGLYFARALVQAHGGTLTLHSVVGEGTAADIRIPARRLADD